jgi:hypothetical protein
LETSKESIENKLGEKEGEINRLLSEEWRDIEKMILENQHTRNRNIIEEIIRTCD